MIKAALVAAALALPGFAQEAKLTLKPPTISLELQNEYLQAHSIYIELQRALEATPAFRAAEDARAEEAKVIAKLAEACGSDFSATFDATKDATGKRKGLICLPKPKPEAKASPAIRSN